ncbi:MAG: hypothetical protein FJ029_14215 [Actinobacteria bacterium]|nr:hypothetical protein [Actinomycetota bacterium]
MRSAAAQWRHTLGAGFVAGAVIGAGAVIAGALGVLLVGRALASCGGGAVERAMVRGLMGSNAPQGTTPGEPAIPEAIAVLADVLQAAVIAAPLLGGRGSDWP